MPTNDERREVAARLRDMAPGSDWPNYVAEACGMDVSKMSNNFHTFTEQLCQRIADLIEPEGRTCRVIMKWDGLDGRDPVCSKCGTYFDDKKWHEQKFCPYCGRRIENADE